MSGRGDDAYWRNGEDTMSILEKVKNNEKLRKELENFKRLAFGEKPESASSDRGEALHQPEVDDGRSTSASNLEEIAPEPRGRVLAEAINIINGERQNVYGSPEDSFSLIGEYWAVFLKERLVEQGAIEKDAVVKVSPKSVAMMMTLFKIAREANQHKRDNIVDAAGYLGIYADMQEEK